MKYLKRNFPIFLLSGSLILVGIFNSNVASGFGHTPTGKLQKDLRQLQSDFAEYKRCVNQNFQTFTYARDFDDLVPYIRTCR